MWEKVWSWTKGILIFIGAIVGMTMIGFTVVDTQIDEYTYVVIVAKLVTLLAAFLVGIGFGMKEEEQNNEEE